MTEPLAPKSLVTKLAEVMAAIERIPKNGWNDHFKYKYATEADVADHVRGLLAERQLVMYPDVKTVEFRGDGKFCLLNVEWTIRDGESADEIKFSVPGMGQDSNDKGPYKAMTGSQKYALMKFFHIPTGDDPEKDDNGAAPKKRAGRQPGESPAEYATRKPEAPDASVTLTFGSAKGQSVRETPTQDLQWYQRTLGENVGNPAKAKWKADNQRMLDAVTGELDRRKHLDLDAPPFEHEGPKPSIPEPVAKPESNGGPDESDRPFYKAKLLEFLKTQNFTTEERLRLGQDFLGGTKVDTCELTKLHNLYLWTGEAEQVKAWRTQA